jgi:hypothetical protein
MTPTGGAIGVGMAMHLGVRPEKEAIPLGGEPGRSGRSGRR